LLDIDSLRPLVLLHAGLGSIALLAGVVAAFAPKRAGLHTRAGAAFATLMLLALASVSLPILARRNVFMIGLGTVAFYSIVEGWRGLWRFRGTLPPEPLAIDKLAAALTAAASIGLGAYGANGLATVGDPMYAVCLAFTALGLVLVGLAWKRWRAPPARSVWLSVHIGHMAGALGAATTAALVINLDGALGGASWLMWVGPTVGSTVWGQFEIRRRGLG
jgi:hypothetical protein